jgi:DNA-binding NtrC family response regulator
VDERRRRLKAWLAGTALLLGVVALAGPQWGFQWQEVTHRGVDLVIADLRLWQESGLDLLFELRRRRPDLPVILLSTSPDAASYLAALRLGAYEFLLKPSDFAELRQVVQRALRPVGRTL